MSMVVIWSEKVTTKNKHDIMRPTYNDLSGHISYVKKYASL